MLFGTFSANLLGEDEARVLGRDEVGIGGLGQRHAQALGHAEQALAAWEGEVQGERY